MAGSSRAGHFFLGNSLYDRQSSCAAGKALGCSMAVAAHALEFVLAYFAAKSIAVDSQCFRAAGLIAVAAFQHAANEFFLEFTDCFFEQDSPLDHHSDERFQLIFHDFTLRRRFGMDSSLGSVESVAGNALIGFSILIPRSRDNVGRQFGRRRLLIPTNLFEIIANVLFIERGLRLARHILIAGPESGGIGRQGLVNPDQLVTN